MPVTLDPIVALIFVVPLPAPVIVIVPELFIAVVEMVIVPLEVVLRVKLPVPVIPPLIVSGLLRTGDNAMVKLSLRAIAPEKIIPPEVVDVVVIVLVPLLPLATVTGFEMVPVPLVIVSEAVELPEVSPNVTVLEPLPRQLILLQDTIPALITNGALKVFVPPKASVPEPL